MQTSDGDFKACKAKLAKLEAALRAMPENDEDFANERAAIAAKISETKAGMAENKPVGARIDGARGRSSRAEQRAKEASEALGMAQRVVEESDMEIACIECELHDLEAALALATTPRHPQKRTLEWTPTSYPQLQLTLHSSSRGFHMPSRKWSGNVVFKRTSQRDCAVNKPRKSIRCDRARPSERGQGKGESEKKEWR